MPPKKRQSFQSRNKLARSRESSPEREARRTADRDRVRACVRTSQHGALQQEADRKRKADALEKESTQHRAVRQQHNRSQMIFSRAAECLQQRTTRQLGTTRQQTDCTQTAHARATESTQQRTTRQHANRTQMTFSRAAECMQQRTTRQQTNCSQMARARSLPWVDKKKAAFNYDSTIDYAADASVAIGAMSFKCGHCAALKWKGESPGMCCNNGRVNLPPLQVPPEPLQALLLRTSPHTTNFHANIRQYNGAFQMTSFGTTGLDAREHGYMPTFRIQGQVYHRAGSLMPPEGQEAKFLQIYFVGDEIEQARLRGINQPRVKQDNVLQLQKMLHEHNIYVNTFKSALERMSTSTDNYFIHIHASKTPQGEHQRRYNAPVSDDVGIVIVGEHFKTRDILLHTRSDAVQRISETHRSYDALQYPLLFCRGEDGYDIALPQTDPHTKQPVPMKTDPKSGQLKPTKTVSASDFYAYRIMLRTDDFNTLHRSGHLFHQFLTDMFAKIEAERLNFIRFNQTKLRAEEYIHLKDAIRDDKDTSEIGQLIILPSSFTGGMRHMHERTQDAMTYVRCHGRPDLFITFTCNPKWPEIDTQLMPGQKSQDRHDLLARVFRRKVVILMDLIVKGSIFGKTRCYMYTIEWQKRGLPHTHILIWLADKIKSNQIDQVISAELPDPVVDKALFDIVTKNLIHGPCGHLKPNSPCMVDNKCSKNFPKHFLHETQADNDGYPLYRRRKPGEGGFETHLKLRGQQITVDNRWVVPHSPLLTKTFNAHINVEVCNSVKSIKYICKYLHKGSDQAVFGLEKHGAQRDEVARYEMGRYISSNEAVWRILNVVPGPTCFDDVRTFEGAVCPTFRDAANKQGLLEDDAHWNATLSEAAVVQSPMRLRSLFAIMLRSCEIADPQTLWLNYRDSMAEDILMTAKRANPTLDIVYTDAIYNQALLLLEDNVLALDGKDLQSYGLDMPRRCQQLTLSKEFLRETSYDLEKLEQMVQLNEPRLTSDQRDVYGKILANIDSRQGGIMFLDAPGGTGNTFLLNLLLAKIRMRRSIAIAVAFSGIAATLLDGGRTAHSTLKLPLNLTRTESPTCNIGKGTGIAKVLQECHLIVWDECTMMHKHGFEALDRTLQDIRGNKQLMGGMTLLLAGDFRQTLPIVSRGTPADELKACLKASYLWPNIKKLRLTTNVRVNLHGDDTASQFAATLLTLGNGQTPANDGLISIPTTLAEVVKTTDQLKAKVFPNLAERFSDVEYPQWMCERAILAPKNDVATNTNLQLLKQLPGNASSYRSIDRACGDSHDVDFPAEFLNSLEPPGTPPHNLLLKVGAPIMLLRNLDAPKLCNGTRLLVKSLMPNLIEATVITGCAKGEDVFIPRIPVIPSDLTFTFKRIQFPVKLSFAMSINKAQGQTLKVAGIDLQSPCFSHGQLYVACSRVGTAKNLYILAPNGRTANIVYPKALQ